MNNEAWLPPPDSLRCFVETARRLSFRGAARAVGLTPAAVGQRIRQLEEMAGARFFQRTTRSVRLTRSGLAALPHAERALEASASCLRAGRGELGPAPANVVLGTRHELGLSWIVPMLPKLTKAHAGLSLHLYFGSGQDLLLRVRTLEIDCAITSSRLTDPKIDAAPLHEETYAFVASRKLVEKNPLKVPSDARRHLLLDTSDSLPLFAYFRDATEGWDSQSFRGVQKLGTIAAIRELALLGEGVAVLPEYYVRRDIERKRLVRLFPRVRALSDYFRLVFRSDDPKAPLYAELAATMRSVPLR